MKVAMPKATQGSTTEGFRFMFFSFSFKIVVLPVRNSSTQVQEAAWERMVAKAAP